jgi:hypothetical protein
MKFLPIVIRAGYRGEYKICVGFISPGFKKPLAFFQ